MNDRVTTYITLESGAVNHNVAFVVSLRADQYQTLKDTATLSQRVGEIGDPYLHVDTEPQPGIHYHYGQDEE